MPQHAAAPRIIRLTTVGQPTSNSTALVLLEIPPHPPK